MPRTTLTLDDDVAAAFDRLRREQGRSLREIVHETLRAGLARLGGRRQSRQAFRTQPLDSGPCLVDSIDDITDVLSIGEGDEFR